MLLLSDILDHTCARASQCIDLVLQQRRGSGPLTEINLLSDSGPRFRAYEALYHYTCEMPIVHKARVVVHYGVEKHFKSEADRLFALYEQYVKAVQNENRSSLELDQLCDFLRQRNETQRARDPTAPFLVVVQDTASQKKPANQRSKLTAPGFHISRTHCMSSTPVESRASRLKVRICNHVFSNMAASTDITSSVVLKDSQDVTESYRRGYWCEAGRKNWDTTVEPLGIHDETVLTRRQSAQQHLLGEGRDIPYADVARKQRCLIAKRERQRERRKLRAEERKELLDADEESSSSSGSSSNTSSQSSSS